MITYEKSIEEMHQMANDQTFFIPGSQPKEGVEYYNYWLKRSQQYEAYWPNNVYGVAKNIKRYLSEGTGKDLKAHALPGVTRHGIHFEMYTHKDLHPYEFPDGDKKVSFRTALSWPHFMDPIYERNVGKEKVLATAAPFCYSYANWKKARTEDGTLDKVERKGTIFFPRHSTNSRIVVTDYKKMWKQLEDLPEEMKPIKVCVFHKDVDLGVAEDAKRRGYEVFCCGVVLDQNFHWRMLDLFAGAKYACSQKITSNAMYATYAGVHYFLLDAKMKYINMDQFTILRMKDGVDPEKALEHKRRVTELFRDIDESKFQERLKEAKRLLGAERIVSPDEYLTQLLDLSDRNYTAKQAKKYNLIHSSTI
jgi:hypothetical protein